MENAFVDNAYAENTKVDYSAKAENPASQETVEQDYQILAAFVVQISGNDFFDVHLNRI